MRRCFMLACLLLWLAGASAAQDLVAPTGPLTPAEQQKKFHLPPGFEIQLVANEPDVHKPMNLKFDARGRMWVTHSLEYPFAAKDDAKARDRITIFSDLGEDGRAKKVVNFAEKLNIPIGILPLDDRTAIGWAIPNLYRFVDTNGDGVADEKKIAFGPFGITDTHGNQNGLTRWVDGWVYACHGFSNQSKVKIAGQGPVVLEMQSGNTYRFRPDGSQIEQISWGQVNPFGLCFDPLGNQFTADCHSKPVTMILREGYYQSFGKPHDGLGYAPEATDKDHGGTGIAGVVYYDAAHFPPEFRDVLFVGNVITSRIHCDRLKWNGSTPWVDKVENFLTCDDPWFRPVDVQLGPDGALYVLDFYNKIIGHYEVPLTHPERDRERGRIWRIVYKGTDGKQKLTPMPDLLEAGIEQLIELLGHDNLTVRMMATNAIVDRYGDRFQERVNKLARAAIAKPTSAPQAAHALWVVFRTGGIDAELAKQLAAHPERLVRTHLMQALGETTKWDDWQANLVREKLADNDRFVKRSAASALARHPNVANLAPLCTVLRGAGEEDTTLAHACKIAIRNQLRSEQVALNIAAANLTKPDYQTVLQIASTAPQGPSAAIVYEAALRGEVDDALLARVLPSAARYVDVKRVDELIGFVGKRYSKDGATRLLVLRSMHEGLAQRGIAAPEKLKSELVEVLRGSLAGDRESLWINLPVPGAAPSKSPWILQARKYTDDKNDAPVISSLHSTGVGERMTGILRSPKFTLPTKLSFWMCGHNGEPKTPDQQKNHARLVLVDGTEIVRVYPPRGDIAHSIKWDLSQHAGKSAYLEVVDNTVADGYAWIAVGRFEPPVLKLPDGPVGDYEAVQIDLFRLVSQLKLTPLAKQIATTAQNNEQSSGVRLAACDALVALEPGAAVTPLSSLMSDAKLPAAARQQAAELLGRCDNAAAPPALVKELKTAPQPVQVAIATALAGKRETGTALLKEIREGRASAALLREPTVIARLKTSQIEKLDAQVAELTAKLTPADNRIAQLIATRREKFTAGKFDAEAGKAIFAKTACAQCHKIGGVGSTIAPALDGIGNRGLDRLLEDMLDPSRNVDQAFRVHNIVTTDGRVLNGFNAREEGKTLILNDNQGKEVRVQLDEIEERTITPLSPMPSNLADQVPEQDFYPLVAYLLSQQAKPEK